MTVSKEKIKEIIQRWGKNENDTGNTAVQIAILTEEIFNLTEHLKKHKHDNNSKRGLFLKLAHRKKLLKYLKKKNPQTYQELISELKL